VPKLRVHNLSMSLDGFAAGPDQSLENPLGERGKELHEWVFATAFGRQMIGQEGGSTGVNEGFMQAGVENIGATIMGRNMFGPIRGEWGDSDWEGWWGDEPPYHHPVFVLTHHPHPPLPLIGTTFTFTDDPIEAVLKQAFAAADGKDVRLGGGASTIRQYLQAGLLDELHLVIAPVLLGSGERIFEDLDDGLPGYEVAELLGAEGVTHVRVVAKR